MPIWLNIISLFVIGFFLIFIEVVIVPGFGIPGVLGSVALIAACYTAFTGLSPIAGVLISSLSILLIVMIFKFLPKTKLWQKTSLAHNLKSSQGYQVGSAEFSKLIGQKGKALTMLRPSGTIIIKGIHYDAVSECDFIAKDKDIEIIEVENNRIVVREAEASASA